MLQNGVTIDSVFLLTPLIEAFYQRHSVTRLILLMVYWAAQGGLGSGRADIIVGALHEPPQLSDFGFARLGILEQVFAVAPHHPLAGSPSPLTGALLKVTVPLWWATARGRNVPYRRNCLMSRRPLPF